MHRIIAGATGLVGKALTEQWLTQQCKITVIGRSKQKIIAQFGQRVSALTWDEVTPELFHDAEVVVNLAGVGLAEKRWTDAQKNEILNSRLETTNKLASMLASIGENAAPLFNASAIGVYGLQAHAAGQLPPRLDETTTIDFDAAPDFLARVGRAWEQATLPAKQAGVRVVNMRFGVVLDKDGGALPQLARPFYFFVGGPIASGEQAVSWVALTDLVRAIDFLLAHPEISGPVNIVAPNCVMQKQFAAALGNALHRPSLLPMPAPVLKIMLGEMARELLLEGQNIYPNKLLELGFTFQDAELPSALKRIYS
jgi:uncharacterized protein (TIGR01777 family)